MVYATFTDVEDLALRYKHVSCVVTWYPVQENDLRNV